eukprot:scaffold27650_cov59-Phaeocystis_antarctica.AAC.3
MVCMQRGKASNTAYACVCACCTLPATPSIVGLSPYPNPLCLPLRHQWTERRRAFERHDRTPAFALAAALAAAFAFAFAAAFVAAVLFATALAVAL